jgi:3-isopropylmalate/(R)-2-methylmalate dehydratase large subunit
VTMTMTEKILARHSGLEEVEPGQLIEAEIDIALGNDITAPMSIGEFRQAGATKVWDPERLVLIPDHFTPNKDIASADQSRATRDFAREQGIKHYYEVGRCGIEHAFLPEQGIVSPGDLIIGADSHTCTYGALSAFSTGVGSTDLAAAMITGKLWFRVPPTIKLIYHGQPGPWVKGKDFILYTIGKIGVDGARYQAIEFTGEAIAALSMDSRFTMANMAIEAGAKNGIFEFDEKTEQYVKRFDRERIMSSDPDASYIDEIEIDVSLIKPQVAEPSLPSNARAAADIEDVHIDQVVVGSCTNGRIEDLRIAAGIIDGNKVHPDVRMIVIPATQQIYLNAMREGLLEIFVTAGAVVSTPTCGPCMGGHMGILAAGERAVATTNRNFIGRMGHRDSEIYLAGPAVAAASALTGKITSPEALGKN